MKALITGSKGMLGRTLMRRLSGHDLVPASREGFDIVDAEATDRAIAETRPELVIHCAGLTDVDRCEAEPDEAYRTNCLGAKNVAAACFRHGARLIAMSSDYVFDGDLGRPYHELDATGPLNVYGASKLAAEEAVRANCPDHLILRTAWLYGQGGPSFLHTMLRLARQGQAAIEAVSDLVGNPTSADAVAAYIEGLIEDRIVGTLHLSCEGSASRYEFTVKAFAMGGIKTKAARCTTDSFPSAAKRPRNSSLEKRGLRLNGLPPMPAWERSLADFLREYPAG